MSIAAFLLIAGLIQTPLPGSTQLDLVPLAPRSQTAAASAGVLFEQVYRNWSPTCDAAAVEGHRITFELTLDARGRIIAGPTVVRPRSDPDWQAAAETARRALIGSAPFDVPPDFEGGDYRPTFLTAPVCARVAEPDKP